MSTVVKAELSREAVEVLRLARDFGPRLLQVVARVHDEQNEITAGHIVEARMSARGPSTLGVVTGRLRRSVRPSRARIVGGNTVVSSIGSNVKYAGVHEFGFQGTVQVRAHTRRFARFEGQQISLRDARSIRGKARKGLRAGTQEVRSHSRRMSFPARAPMAMGVQDRLDVYARVMSEAVVADWEGGGR